MMQLKTRKEEWWVPVFFFVCLFFLNKNIFFLEFTAGPRLDQLDQVPLGRFQRYWTKIAERFSRGSNANWEHFQTYWMLKKKTKWYTIVILTRANLHLTAAHVSSILLTLAVHSSFQPYCQFELKTQILHYLQAANWCRTHQTAELPGAMTLIPNPLRQNTSHYGNQQYHDLLERPLLSFITVSWRKVKSKPAQSYFFQNQLSPGLSLILPLGCCKFIQHLGLWYFQIKDPEARDTIENKIPLLRSWKTFFFSTRSQILRENEHVKSNAAY